MNGATDGMYSVVTLENVTVHDQPPQETSAMYESIPGNADHVTRRPMSGGDDPSSPMTLETHNSREDIVDFSHHSQPFQSEATALYDTIPGNKTPTEEAPYSTLKHAKVQHQQAQSDPKPLRLAQQFPGEYAIVNQNVPETPAENNAPFNDHVYSTVNKDKKKKKGPPTSENVGIQANMHQVGIQDSTTEVQGQQDFT